MSVQHFRILVLLVMVLCVADEGTKHFRLYAGIPGLLMRRVIGSTDGNRQGGVMWELNGSTGSSITTTSSYMKQLYSMMMVL